MRIAEIYQSVQGEGMLTGTRSAFIRTSGCNLRCVYCDTPYASWHPEGDDLGIDEIADQVLRMDTEHVVVTGGEPMLMAELIPLCERLHTAGKHITIETAGTLYLPVRCDLMSISPKTANSTPHGAIGTRWINRHERTRYAPQVIDRLVAEYSYQFKFVVCQPDDFVEIEDYLARHPQIDRSRVLLMPEGTTRARLESIGGWLEVSCTRRGFGFCPRRQIEWFGLRRAT
jgi:7-carboxy-7-deazaguanine synthase